MPWLLNEDAAIKKKLAGLTVTDSTAPVAGRPVDVKFLSPDTELDNLTFPAILIKYAGISRASEREHRGPTVLPYTPEGAANPVNVTDPETGATVVWDTTADFDPTLSPHHVQDHPLPYNLDYQIEIWSRYNSHMIDLAAKLARLERLPERFGFLEVPEDGTVRTLELLGGPVTMESARDSNRKRIFRLGYVVRVASELDVYAVEQIAKSVDSVDLQMIVFSMTIPLDEQHPEQFEG